MSILKHYSYFELGDLLFFDKRFNGIPKEKQRRIVSFSHVSAEELKSLRRDEGDVYLLSTGNFTGFTTRELAADKVNQGEVISIPTGGSAIIKYYSGSFVDSGNILAVSSSSKVSLKYVYYCLLFKNDEIASYYRGASIKHPYMPDILKIKIPVPSIEAQEQIVNELDSIKELIGKKVILLRKYSDLAESFFYEQFGDPVVNDKGWNRRLMKDICTKVTDGTHDTPKRLSDGVMFITGKHIRPFTIDYEHCDYVSEEDHKEIIERCYPEKGDVLYTNIGANLGTAAMNTIEPVFSMKNVALLKLDPQKANGQYIQHFLNNSRVKDLIIAEKAQGGAQKFLGLSSIKKIDVLLPPIGEQIKFANRISVVDDMVRAENTSLDKINLLFNSRLKYFFDRSAT